MEHFINLILTGTGLIIVLFLAAAIGLHALERVMEPKKCSRCGTEVE